MRTRVSEERSRPACQFDTTPGKWMLTRLGFITDMAMVTDGTSNTALASERLMGDFNQGIATIRRDIFNAPSPMPATPEEAFTRCEAPP